MESVVNKITEKSKTCSEISMKQFLDFLRTAYQVTDSVEDTLAQAEGTSEVIDWIKLRNTEFVDDNTSNNSSQTPPDSVMRQKLDEVLSEGLLDSVLPYLVPNTTSKPKTGTKLSGTIKIAIKSTNNTIFTEKNSNSSQKTQSKDSLARRRSSDSVTTTKHPNRTEYLT